jgi:hypothetical protein
MQRQLAAFVERPCKLTYLAARDALLGQSPLPLSASDFVELEGMLDLGEHQLLRDRLEVLPPSKALSPRVHFLAAEAALALGDFEDVELERSLFVLALQGLLATGDGTPANPFIVCHTTDEHDALAALGHEPAGQSLVEFEGRFCDVWTCSDGREVWFDVSDLLAPRQLKRRSSAQRRRGIRRPRRAVHSRH